MKELNLNEIQKHALGCMIYFDKICRKYNLKYTLGYGSLIGAVRHKGFIPWDDDLDVLMLREDYEKLKKVFLNNEEVHDKYKFLCYENNKEYYYTIGRMVDTETKIEFTNGCKNVEEMGVFIDIYPLDYIVNNKYKIYLISFLMDFIIRGLFINNTNFSSIKGKTILHEYIKKYILKNIYSFIGNKRLFLLYKILFNSLKNETENLTCLWNGNLIKKIKYPKKYFTNMKEIDFNNKRFFITEDYDDLLKISYKNYMKLPPIEDRKPQHSYRAYLRGE